MFSVTKVKAVRPVELSKRYDLRDGNLTKTVVAALSRGQVETLELEGIEALAEVISRLTPAEALMLGVPQIKSATTIVTRRMLSAHLREGDIARTADNFVYPEGAGFLFIDHDGLQDGTCLSREDLLERLYACAPSLRQVKILALPSSSSHICRTDTGEDLTGARGLHLYIPVKDARDIPRIGKVLTDLLWLGDQGYVRIASNGARLLRSPIDSTVWQPSRLVFAAGAICANGLEQRRGAPVIVNPEGADLWDSVALLPTLDAAAQALVQATRDRALALSQKAADEQRAVWLEDFRPGLLRDLGAGPEAREPREELLAAVENAVLGPGLLLFVRRAGEVQFAPVTVEAILADRIGYHRAITLDPIEPDYNGRAPVGCLFLDGRTPVLHSMAHGGTSYRLERRTTIVELHPGRMAEATEAVLTHMRGDSRFMDHGDLLVTIHDGKRQPIDEYRLELMLGDILFLKADAKGRMKPSDPPSRLLRQILSLGAQRRLRRLTFILRRPTLNARGELLTRPGHHAGEGLYLDYDPEEWPEIPLTLSQEDARAALKMIWKPFAAFPFVDAASRGALLAAIFTAILRPSLPTAPLVASDAPNHACGKTLALEAVASLAAGEPVSVAAPFDGDQAEMRKLLTSTALAGDSTLLFDNCRTLLDSPQLSAFLTGEYWSDRLLGSNVMRNGLPTQIFLGVTGVNLQFSAELRRRTIAWRIDPQVERPHERAFDFCPREQVMTFYKEIVAASLALIRTAQAADLPRPAHTFASYPVWDRLIRTAVRHAAQLTDGFFADPVPQAVRAVAETEEVIDLHALLAGLMEAFGGEAFGSVDVCMLIEDPANRRLGALMAGATQRPDRLSPKSLGRYLAQYVDRPSGHLVLRARRGSKALSFFVERVPQEAPESA
ncbi:DNA primase small subunit domain-containing protein [Cereibacter sphaeroides]|nr:hypothetical protein APX01_21310 [Cereibacter sphaeroides]ATN65862.1 hypothetical protein A3857_21305 [Cereibacter sphaeroides]QJC86783.1 hypothetical protein HGN32_21185 [Cereibacter sphaeroides]GEM95081.1 hypothetical protein RSP03_41480 [Cereibacter sphaeroides]